MLKHVKWNPIHCRIFANTFQNRMEGICKQRDINGNFTLMNRHVCQLC